MKRDILVPFDGSANAVEALRVAIDMAKAMNEAIVLVNVQPSYETPHTKEFFSKQEIADFRLRKAIEVMRPGEELLQRSGVPFTAKMRVGDPREQICREARGQGETGIPPAGREVRMIVMGSRGLHPFLEMVLGSVSMGVLHDTPCPVLLVPHAA